MEVHRWRHLQPSWWHWRGLHTVWWRARDTIERWEIASMRKAERKGVRRCPTRHIKANKRRYCYWKSQIVLKSKWKTPACSRKSNHAWRHQELKRWVWCSLSYSPSGIESKVGPTSWHKEISRWWVNQWWLLLCSAMYNSWQESRKGIEKEVEVLVRWTSESKPA